MDYIIEMLESKLKDELIAQETARHCLSGNMGYMENLTVEAFKESKRLADERIPQLKKAIAIIRRS